MLDVSPRFALRFRLPVIAALCVALVAAFATAAGAKPLYGLQGVPAYAAASQAQVDTALDAAKKANAKVIRVEVLWSKLEPTAAGVRDASELAAVDRVVNGAAARGMKTELMIDSTPCWASSSPDRGSCAGADPNVFEVTRYPPANPAGYVDLSTFLVARYAANLAAFEVWNEPDQVNEIYWAGPNKVRGYVALAKAVYPALKQVAPRVPVLAGSFVGGNGKWLQALYDAGLKGSYDGLAVHFYDLPLSSLTTTRAVQKRNGDRKPLWLTEFGFTSCYAKGGPAFKIDHACNTRKGQAQNLTDTLRKVASVSWVKAAFVYMINDQSDAYQFGLLTALGLPKPAFAAVRNIFAGKKVRVAKPKMAPLTARRGRVTVKGTASQTELFTLRVWRAGRLAYRATLRTDRFGAYRLVLPAVIGTSQLRVRLSGTWTGSVTRRR
ncbi:cellulase family glycosylhydrolase [Baekduia sp.]|uniref:cellulase family glycosylhydrolase n=1 Tax=Baekduia sp. TaxID=2600305 RepID=UPI002DFD4C2A|nr:cellulase family glycosylhydrolase [Baekduia sp.]